MRYERPSFVSGITPQDTQLSDVLIVSPLKHEVHKLVKELSACAPLKGLQHLKRVRQPQEANAKDSQQRLDVILCPSHPWPEYGHADSAPDAAALPPEVDHFLQQHGLQPRPAQVPACAPQTREEWAVQNAIWPTAWRQPEVTAFRASMQAPEIDDATYERMCGYLDLAFTQAQAGPVCNGAVIVDSRQGEVVAVGTDERHQHPLRHAAMTAIANAAARDRQLWPLPAEPSSKRPRLDGSAPVTLDGSSSAAAELDTAPDGDPLASDRPYLCTGWDCYLVREPCAMCAMALTHSRVRWVVFCQPDERGGAVGGSFRLQAQRSLNHHFKVLHMPKASCGKS